jgi:hypothetical protein
MNLTNIETAIIFGIMLGDGYLHDRLNGTYRLKIEHCLKQKEYVLWTYEHLKRLCSNVQPPVETPRRKTSGPGVLFYTNSSPILGDIHKLFYKKQPDGSFRKTITKELIDQIPMSPYVLATLWMDDGSVRNDTYSGKLASMGFTRPEQELLLIYFKKWGLNCKVVWNQKTKNHSYITVPAAEFQKLVDIIEPVIINVPTMVYKLNACRS